jgi:hypothetical protein
MSPRSCKKLRILGTGSSPFELITGVFVHMACRYYLLATPKTLHMIKIPIHCIRSTPQVRSLEARLILGSYFPWRATAIGRNSSSAKQFLEKRYNPDMELEDAIHTALLTLKEGFEGEMTKDTVEIGSSFYKSSTDGRNCK